jgi:hypothetical protein
MPKWSSSSPIHRSRAEDEAAIAERVQRRCLLSDVDRLRSDISTIPVLRCMSPASAVSRLNSGQGCRIGTEYQAGLRELQRLVGNERWTGINDHFSADR